jgi:short chain dehydrogenase
MKLTNRTILITGGSAGIGLAFAQKFLELGNHVIVTGRRQSILDELKANYPKLHTIKSDVADPAQIAALATSSPTTTTNPSCIRPEARSRSFYRTGTIKAGTPKAGALAAVGLIKFDGLGFGPDTETSVGTERSTLMQRVPPPTRYHDIDSTLGNGGGRASRAEQIEHRERG